MKEKKVPIETTKMIIIIEISTSIMSIDDDMDKWVMGITTVKLVWLLVVKNKARISMKQAMKIIEAKVTIIEVAER